MTVVSIWLLFAVLTYNGNFPQHINTPTYCGMQYRIINTFVGLSAFGSPLDTTMCLAKDCCCDVASVLRVTSFVSLSYIVFGMLIIACRWI